MTSTLSDVSDKPTQTTPKGETIPVPEREDVLDALRKAAAIAKKDEDEESN